MENLSVGKHFKSSNTAKGTMGELAVMRLLRKQGFKVSRKRHTGYDLLATNKVTGQVLRIEVKLAYTGKDKKYRATTVKCGQYGSTDFRKSDFIIMLCQEKFTGGTLTPFIIPCKDINTRQIAITSNPQTYTGKYAIFRNNWSILQ